MSVAPTVASPLGLTNAEDVAIVDGRLTYVHGAGSDGFKVEEVVSVFKAPRPPGSGRRFIIIALKESSEEPFHPVGLATDNIPAQLERYIVDSLPPHLRRNESNEVHVVVSRKSGLGHALQFWQGVLGPLWKLALQQLAPDETQSTSVGDSGDEGLPQVLVTETAHSIRQFARQLRANGTWSAGPKRSKTIVLLSGDGGVVDLLNGSDAAPPADVKTPVMAMLPLGTGNALFHSLHKPLYSDPGPSPMVLALQTLFRGAPTQLPVFRASFSPGSKIVSFADKLAAEAGELAGNAELSLHDTAVSHLNGAIVASYGFHASIVSESDTPAYRAHGAKRFGMVAQELLRESRSYRARVEVRRPGAAAFEALPRDQHAYVLSIMVSNLERAFTISPASEPLDGKLRLVHFGPVGGQRAMEIMMKAYDNGKHVGMKWDDGEAVGYEEVDEVRVVVEEEDERWRKVCVDGTIVEVPQGGQMTVSKLEKGPFRFVVDDRVTPS